MTNEELLLLIDSDEEASALASTGNDTACARRCSEIAPRHVVKTLIGELGIISLYANPADAEAVLQTIEQVGQANPIVGRVWKWMQPSAPGVDFGDAKVRGLLTVPVESGGLGLSLEQAAPLLAASERETVVAVSQVSDAMSTRRPEGVIQ